MKIINYIKNLFRKYHVYGNVSLGAEVIILPYAVIGAPNNPEDLDDLQPLPKTIIGKNSYVSSHVVIYEGAEIGKKVFIDPFCRIGAKTKIGDNCRIIYGARIHDNVIIGNNCTIGGSCSDNVKIGNAVSHFGRTVHPFNSPKSDWTTTSEPSPVIEDNAVIGANSILMGGIIIGKNAYVRAGEIVKESVPANHVFSKGKKYSKEEWKGSLSNNNFFNDERK